MAFVEKFVTDGASGGDGDDNLGLALSNATYDHSGGASERLGAAAASAAAGSPAAGVGAAVATPRRASGWGSGSGSDPNHASAPSASPRATPATPGSNHRRRDGRSQTPRGGACRDPRRERGARPSGPLRLAGSRLIAAGSRRGKRRSPGSIAPRTRDARRPGHPGPRGPRPREPCAGSRAALA